MAVHAPRSPLRTGLSNVPFVTAGEAANVLPKATTCPMFLRVSAKIRLAGSCGAVAGVGFRVKTASWPTTKAMADVIGT
jgi:hypothetical protein